MHIQWRAWLWHTGHHDSLQTVDRQGIQLLEDCIPGSHGMPWHSNGLRLRAGQLCQLNVVCQCGTEVAAASSTAAVAAVG